MEVFYHHYESPPDTKSYDVALREPPDCVRYGMQIITECLKLTPRRAVVIVSECLRDYCSGLWVRLRFDGLYLCNLMASPRTQLLDNHPLERLESI